MCLQVCAMSWGNASYYIHCKTTPALRITKSKSSTGAGTEKMQEEQPLSPVLVFFVLSITFLLLRAADVTQTIPENLLLVCFVCLWSFCVIASYRQTNKAMQTKPVEFNAHLLPKKPL